MIKTIPSLRQFAGERRWSLLTVRPSCGASIRHAFEVCEIALKGADADSRALQDALGKVPLFGAVASPFAFCPGGKYSSEM